MKSVQTRVLPLVLLALGCGAFLPCAQAELPKAGEYRGTLTILQIITGTTGETGVLSKTTVKASARVYTDGTLRVAFVSETRAPMFGKLVESEGATLFRDAVENYPVAIRGSRMEISLGSVSDNLQGADGSTTPVVWHYALKMVRTGR